jgi:hypothetical protein
MSGTERNKYIHYINDNINELKVSFRKEVLQTILYSNLPESKIVEKGNGTQVKYGDIDDQLLKNIYNYIYQKIELSSDLV